MVTAEEIRQLQKDCEQEFIDKRKGDILSIIEYDAKNMRFSSKQEYHPLLDSFYQELRDNGFQVQLNNSIVTISW